MTSNFRVVLGRQEVYVGSFSFARLGQLQSGCGVQPSVSDINDVLIQISFVMHSSVHPPLPIMYMLVVTLS